MGNLKFNVNSIEDMVKVANELPESGIVNLTTQGFRDLGLTLNQIKEIVGYCHGVLTKKRNTYIRKWYKYFGVIR